MSTLPEQSGCWLDGNAVEGVLIREHVRRSAIKNWPLASRKTRLAMGNTKEAGALMELAASRASAYLNTMVLARGHRPQTLRQFSQLHFAGLCITNLLGIACDFWNHPMHFVYCQNRYN